MKSRECHKILLQSVFFFSNKLNSPQNVNNKITPPPHFKRLKWSTYSKKFFFYWNINKYIYIQKHLNSTHRSCVQCSPYGKHFTFVRQKSSPANSWRQCRHTGVGSAWWRLRGRGGCRRSAAEGVARIYLFHKLFNSCICAVFEKQIYFSFLFIKGNTTILGLNYLFVYSSKEFYFHLQVF